jgi:hypothetical protein
VEDILDDTPEGHYWRTSLDNKPGISVDTPHFIIYRIISNVEHVRKCSSQGTVEEKLRIITRIIIGTVMMRRVA